MKNTKTIPTFNSLKEEVDFWVKEDSVDYINWSSAKKVLFPDLKKTTHRISLSLPVDIIEKIKVQANKNDIPYQALIKFYISKGLNNSATI